MALRLRSALGTRKEMASPVDQIRRNPALDEIGEARQLLELAAQTVARALVTPQRLRAIGDAMSARRLLDEARQRIERAALWTRPC